MSRRFEVTLFPGSPPLPSHLRARAWHVPRLAWVASRAFGSLRRPRWLAGVWAIGPAMWIHVPLFLSLVLDAGLAADPRRTAVVAVTHQRLQLRAFLVAIAWFGLLVWLAAVAPTWFAWPALAGTVVPAVVEATAVVVRVRHDDARAMSTLVRELRQRGEQVWAVGTWASWPPGRGAGLALVDELLPQVPVGVVLVAVARTRWVADQLVERGFRSAGVGHLLVARPCDGGHRR